jgi:streptogramin lyase
VVGPSPRAGTEREMWSGRRGPRLTQGFIGGIDASGALSELALPTQATNPDGIAAGPGRTVWVTETGSDAIARIKLRA